VAVPWLLETGAGCALQGDNEEELGEFQERTWYVVRGGGPTLTEGIVRTASRMREPVSAGPVHNWVRRARSLPCSAPAALCPINPAGIGLAMERKAAYLLGSQQLLLGLHVPEEAAAATLLCLHACRSRCCRRQCCSSPA
jgi:hypothetical protein